MSIPEVCPHIYDPVCGCDGRTYANHCFAAAAAANVAFEGECDVPHCGGNDECATGDYCAKHPGDCGGNGTCEPRPDICPMIYDPVCGCDGETYANACVAAGAGVSVAARGMCEAPSCDDNRDCAADGYCATEIGDCGGTGMCETRPEICPAIFDPVCGCDEETYANACVAAMASVSVSAPGACESCVDDAFEDNDDLAGAVPIPPGEHEGQICAGDQDWFSVDVCAGGTLTVDLVFANASGDLDMGLRSADGSLIAASASATDDEQIVYTVDHDATVIIQIVGYAGAQNAYGLDVALVCPEPSAFAPRSCRWRFAFG